MSRREPTLAGTRCHCRPPGNHPPRCMPQPMLTVPWQCPWLWDSWTRNPWQVARRCCCLPLLPQRCYWNADSLWKRDALCSSVVHSLEFLSESGMMYKEKNNCMVIMEQHMYPLIGVILIQLFSIQSFSSLDNSVTKILPRVLVNSFLVNGGWVTIYWMWWIWFYGRTSGFHVRGSDWTFIGVLVSGKAFNTYRVI